MMSPTVTMGSRSSGNGDPLTGPPTAARAVRQRAAQAQRGPADLVRPRARGADGQLPAALGQGPLRAVDVRPGAVRALHREDRPHPGEEEGPGTRRD